DCAADTVPAFTTTVAVWLIAMPLMVAETVFDPAAVDVTVPVATPLALVEVTGWVSVFPAVGVAARVTVAPSIGFPLASRAVTVIVEVPLPAVIGDVAVTVDRAADTAPAVTVTGAVCASTMVPSTVAVTVFVPAAVELNAPVICPPASVVPTGCVSVLPSPVAASVTLAPPTGFPLASRTVTVIVDGLPPAVMGDVAATVDREADGVPAVSRTAAVWVIATASIVAETVLDPAAVEVKVPVATPLASVVPSGWVSVFPVVGVAASVTVAPWIGLPCASRAVTVMVEVPLPAVIGEVAVTLDWPADTTPGFTR